MDSFLIKGGVPLHGEVTISGAKNAVLPIMAATLLTPEPCVIRRVPHLSDVRFMARFSNGSGRRLAFRVIRCAWRQKKSAARAITISCADARLDLYPGAVARAVEESARFGCREVAIIGARPINLHLKGIEALGRRSGSKVATWKSRQTTCRLGVVPGGRAGFDRAGHGQRDDGRRARRGNDGDRSARANRRWWTCELSELDGGEDFRRGSPTVTITGVKQLHGTEHEVIPDRIEAATYAIAAGATNGEVTLKGARADQMHAVIDKLHEAGVSVERRGANLLARRNGRLKSADVTTLPYSGFPTDVQAQMMALMTLTPGISIITERIFESRFMHVSELGRLGADIEIEGPSAIVKGGKPLSGAPVMASDLRASGSAGDCRPGREGTTQVNPRLSH